MKATTRTRTIFLALAALIVATLIASCAAAAPDRAAKSSGEGTADQSAPSGGQPGAPAAAPQALPPEAGRAPGTGNNGPLAPSNAAQPWDRKIIRTVSLSLIVADVEGSLAAVRDAAVAAGGFVAQSTTRYDGEFQVATITIQIPAAQFDGTVDAIRRLAVKVETENGSSQDVTEEFSDLEAQVRNLQATEASLQRLMDRATRIEDILALQRELTNVRGEIERRQGRLNFLERRTEMSTLTVSLRPEGLAKPPKPEPVWRPLETARRAWEASTTLLLTVAEVLIATVVFLWWLIPLVLIGAHLWRSRRAQRRQAATQ